jgi:hypothetical protein
LKSQSTLTEHQQAYQPRPPNKPNTKKIKFPAIRSPRLSVYLPAQPRRAVFNVPKQKILMTPLKVFSGITCLLLIAQATRSQGCSDAGFCTINSFKPGASMQHAGKEPANQLKFGIGFGGADNEISTLSNYIEYNRQINPKLGLDVKLTSLSQSGNGVSAFGLSDVFVNANLKTGATRFTAGVKLPFANGNKKEGNLPLPMDYQASLGTVDLLLGWSGTIKKLQWVVALQQPLTQNKNQFLAENYPVTSKLRSFQSTRNFKRKGDVLLRAAYPFQAGNKFSLTPSLLPIIHLGKDRFTNAAGTVTDIEGSQGLTLNANLFFDYKVSANSGFQLGFGAPLVVREKRPDGLTRSFVASLEYRIRF